MKRGIIRLAFPNNINASLCDFLCVFERECVCCGIVGCNARAEAQRGKSQKALHNPVSLRTRPGNTNVTCMRTHVHTVYFCFPS